MELSAGAIRIGGSDMTGIAPHKRPTALVFQNLAPSPLMPVWQNIAFALKVRSVGRAARRKRADELLDLIAMSGHGDRMCHELSGGQRRRVAIAANPAVLLLDEPLSALDRNLRERMRGELCATQQREGITFLSITHNQGKPLALSDEVGVRRIGALEQVADAQTLYDRPHSASAASFVGENNVFRGVVSTLDLECATVATSVRTHCPRDRWPPGESAVRASGFAYDMALLVP